MRVLFHGNPSYTLAQAVMEVGEELIVERGAMVAMSAGMEVKASAGDGNLLKAGLRKLGGQESFFTGRYIAAVGGAWVSVAPPFPGDVQELYVRPDRSWVITTGAFLAGEPSVSPDLAYGGLRLVALGEGITTLHLNGQGVVLVASYGALQRITLEEDQEIIVDTGHLVAWNSSVKIKLGMLGNIATTNIIGEGLVGVLKGPGEVLIQTRAEQGFKDWLLPTRGAKAKL